MGDYEYFYKKQEENEPQTSLEYEICQGIIPLNDRFLNNCLLNLQQNFVEETQNALLKTNFFPELQLEKLIEIHTKLQEELKVVEYDYKQIFYIFQKLEEEFLTYCDVIPKTRQLMDFIKTKMISNKEIKEEVERLTKKSFLSNRNKDAQDKIVDLLYRISEAMMRFPMVLGVIAKEARKLDLITIEKEAQKAHEMMHKIMFHVDKCSEDNKNIETVRKYEVSMNCVGELREQGLLLSEVHDVSIRMKNSDKTLQCSILVFEELLVVFKVTERTNYQYKNGGKDIVVDFLGDPKIRSITMEYQLHSKFKIAKFGEINPIVNETKLELITFERGILEDPSRSFEVIFSTADARQEFAETLKERKSIIEKFVHVNPGSKHRNHDFHTFQNDYLNSPKMHLKCFQCNNFLGGIVLTAIYCKTCDQYFHLPCLELDTSDDTDNEDSSIPGKSGTLYDTN